ncbi:MAG: very short patch repair endonuclease [Candidatus Saccharimonadales bacterium]
MDVFDEAKRREVMSKIRSENTQAEVIVFSYLKREGVYFQKHYKNALGKPDVAQPRKKRAIFIDSDFWHGRTYDALAKRRGSDTDYWVLKIAANKARDERQRKQLVDLGWGILEVWEEDIKRKRTRETTLEKIKTFLT